MSFDRDIMFGYAKKKIKKIKNGVKFNTYDIFCDFEEYDKLLKNDKTTIGKLFKNEVELNNIKGVVLTGQKKNGRLEYEKIDADK